MTILELDVTFVHPPIALSAACELMMDTTFTTPLYTTTAVSTLRDTQDLYDATIYAIVTMDKQPDVNIVSTPLLSQNHQTT